MPVPRPGVQERILLHLRDYVEHAGRVEVPFALSQMGIANSVAIARSNVPRAISGMREQGLLVERQAHVTGVSRKRKAYFLTDEGIKVANGIWEKVSTQNVRLKFPDGSSQNVPLVNALELTDLPLRHVDILRYIDDNGSLDLSVLSAELIERDLSKHIEKQLVTSFNDLPRTRKFFLVEKRKLMIWLICLKKDLHQFLFPELRVLEKPLSREKFSKDLRMKEIYYIIVVKIGKVLEHFSKPLQNGNQQWVIMDFQIT